VNSSSALAKYGGTSPTMLVDSQEIAENSEKSVSDELEISEPGKLLGRLGTLKTPSWQSVNEFKKEFSAMLNKVLNEAGIDSNPPFKITQNVNSGVFSVTGDNPKAAQVQDILNNNEELKMLHHNMQAIASHIPGIEASLKFQREYRAANGIDEIQNVVSKYGSLLYDKAAHHSFMTIFDSEGTILQMDGKEVA
jgi:hypothetical protein